MNIAVPPSELLIDESPVDAHLRAPILLGMPHLSLGGLSENWLLKELGHRHWLLLAKLAGRRVPEFRDVDGTPVYAAFCAVRIEGAGFDLVREHDELSITSAMARASRTQFVSTHELVSGPRLIGRVELCSVFVKRAVPGRNRSAARFALDLFPEPTRFAVSSAATLAAEMRSGDWKRHFGFKREAADVEGSFPRLIVRPCPSQDFNGAEFLYFAAFQSLVDRAEWELIGAAPQHLPVRARDLVYHGNIEIGDAIAIDIIGRREKPGSCVHWCRLSRLSDGARLADIFTFKAA